jgi:FkbM family methyltransferase
MDESTNRLAKLLMRLAPALGWLRRVPILGNFLSWISGKLVPRDSLVWVQIQHGPCEGLWIRLNPRTGQNVQKGIGEPQVQKALVDHLRAGMTFYDLGANIGFFSLMAARLVGQHGHVVSFEADPAIAARLQENVSRNQFTHAHVEEKAVWSEPASISFARADPNTSPDRGLGHVAPSGSAPGTITVEAVSLDHYTASHVPPDFVKCDVEGAEGAVFQGAAQLLSGKRPMLLVEMHCPENHRALLDLFTGHGYHCRNLDDNHVLALPQ